MSMIDQDEAIAMEVFTALETEPNGDVESVRFFRGLRVRIGEQRAVAIFAHLRDTKTIVVIAHGIYRRGGPKPEPGIVEKIFLSKDELEESIQKVSDYLRRKLK